mgnify:CR=1 FL=1
MEVKIRPLNKGETFCCSVKCAKSLFKNTNVFLNFAFLGRDYATFANTKDAYYLKNKIKGRVIASLYAHSKTEKSILSFYVLKQDDFSQDLKKEFELVYMPKLIDFYLAQLNVDGLSDHTKMILIEFYKGQLFLHKHDID